MEASRSNRWRSTDFLKKKHLSTHVGATAHDDFCWWTYCLFGWCNDPGKLPAKLRWAGFIALRTYSPRYILSKFSRCMSWYNRKSSFWSRNLFNNDHEWTWNSPRQKFSQGVISKLLPSIWGNHPISPITWSSSSPQTHSCGRVAMKPMTGIKIKLERMLPKSKRTWLKILSGGRDLQDDFKPWIWKYSKGIHDYGYMGFNWFWIRIT